MSTINPKWTAYNNLNNEGYEGYNPYPKYIETVETTSETVTTERRKIAISGNTYSHRDLFRGMGCSWDAGRKAWVGMLKPGKFVCPSGCTASVIG